MDDMMGCREMDDGDRDRIGRRELDDGYKVRVAKRRMAAASMVSAGGAAAVETAE